MERAAVERAGDAHLARGAAHAQVAGAVDRERLVRRERLGEHVGQQALDGPAAVEGHARRAADRPAVDGDLAPARGRVRGRGPAGGRQPQRERKRQRGAEVGAVAGLLDAAQLGRVDQAVARLGRRQRGRHEPRHDRADRDLAVAGAVQPRQLAAGAEPREAVVPRLEAAARGRRRLAGRPARPGPGDEDPAGAAEAPEGARRLGHDWLEVTAVGEELVAEEPLEPDDPLEPDEPEELVVDDVPDEEDPDDPLGDVAPLELDEAADGVEAELALEVGVAVPVDDAAACCRASASLRARAAAARARRAARIS